MHHLTVLLMGLSVEKLSFNDHLVAPLVVVDVSKKADEDYIVSAKDIQQFEDTHGMIPKRSFVTLLTGWYKYWDDRKKYHNNYQFSTVGIDAAKILLTRDIIELGIDTLSPDKPTSGFIVHQAILGVGKFIVENVAYNKRLPNI